MTTGSTEGGRSSADSHDDLASLGAVLRQLIAEGLGPAMGLDGDWRKRSAIERVARLGHDELNRRIDLIWRTEYPKLVSYAQGKLRNGDDATEVVQDAFKRILQADPDLREPDALRGYVWSTLRNSVADRGTKMNRDRAVRERHEPVDLDLRLASRDRPLDEQVCDRLTVVVMLAMLSPRQRACIMLRAVDDLSVKEVAARLGIDEGNVKRTCHDLRARLAAAFKSSFCPR